MTLTPVWVAFCSPVFQRYVWKRLQILHCSSNVDVMALKIKRYSSVTTHFIILYRESHKKLNNTVYLVFFYYLVLDVFHCLPTGQIDNESQPHSNVNKLACGHENCRQVSLRLEEMVDLLYFSICSNSYKDNALLPLQLESNKSFLLSLLHWSVFEKLSEACALRLNQCCSFHRLRFPKLYSGWSEWIADSHDDEKMTITTRLTNTTSFISNLMGSDTLRLRASHASLCILFCHVCERAHAYLLAAEKQFSLQMN